MADTNDRVEKNVAGKWYVDNQCIACGLCAELAPEVFELDWGVGYAYVKRQPDAAMEAEAREALDQCPVEAIGDDGE